MRKAEAPLGGWIGPNGPDPDGRDLVDPIYAEAKDRVATHVAVGSKLNARTGKLEWIWKKL